MKTVRLGVSKKQYTTITVQVPDAFDERRLWCGDLRDIIRDTCNKLPCQWDWWENDPVEVEEVKLLKGDEEAQELRDFTAVDLTEALAKHDGKLLSKAYAKLKQSEAD